MTRRNQPPQVPARGSPPQDLSREEGRYLDGEASPEEVRRIEHQLAADPERAARLMAWQDAMDLWREDGTRTALALCSQDQEGADDLADRILRAGPRALQPRLRALSAAPWYAAAAALLMTIGVTGTLLARAGARNEVSATLPPQVGSLSEAVMDIMVDGPELLPRLASTKEGR